MSEHIVLTDEQSDLVEHYLSVVDWVIYDHIRVNETVPGLGREDLYQEGCVWLCKAAAAYDGKTASFGTYARTVVRNGLISYCRKISQAPQTVPLAADLTPDENDTNKEYGYEPQVADKTGEIIDSADAAAILDQMKARYTGTARLGIEALEWKIKGLEGAEIAVMYGVRTNHVSAWIARASQKLKKDRQFLEFCSKTN